MNNADDDNQRMGRKIGISVAALFITIIIAWTVLITVAINNQPEPIEVKSVIDNG